MSLKFFFKWILFKGYPQKASSLPRGGGSRKPQKIRTPIVITNEIPLFKPDKRGRGSENPDFFQTSFMDGPLLYLPREVHTEGCDDSTPQQTTTPHNRMDGDKGWSETQDEVDADKHTVHFARTVLLKWKGVSCFSYLIARKGGPNPLFNLTENNRIYCFWSCLFMGTSVTYLALVRPSHIW